jgi:hypothetical protein
MSKASASLRAITAERLHNQILTRAGLRRPEDVVEWLGAVQAQEYEPAKWALGLRMRDGAVDADIERAFEEGRILRTHVMRPTWHFVTPADIRWMAELTAPRLHRLMSTYHRQLGLDAGMLVRGAAIVERALQDHQYLTRNELAEHLRRADLALNGIRLAHVAMYAELEGIICSGPRRGKQFTYGLVAERAPRAARRSRDEAIATLTRRYFSSHGPATIRDFVWWSGLSTADAKRGLDMNKARRMETDGATYWTIGPRSHRATRDRPVHLLPIYDEYLVAYRDREAVPQGPSRVPAGAREPVNFRHALVIAGQVGGTWRTKRQLKAVLIDAVPLRPLTRAERRCLGEAVRHYERFLCTPVECPV